MAKKHVLRSPSANSAKAGQTAVRINNVRIRVRADKQQCAQAEKNQHAVETNALAVDRGTLSRNATRVDALEKSIAERELEIRDLYQTIDQLQQRLTERDDRIEETLYELRAAATVASLSGPAASKQLAYIQLLRRIRTTVQRILPRDGIVAVVSKGCEEMARLYGRSVWHFPQDRKGDYLGYYPSNSQSAIAQLATLEARGAEFFLVPATAFWWLDKYKEFASYLEARSHLIIREEESCAIFALRERGPWASLHKLIANSRTGLEREPVILDWHTGQCLKARFPECNVFSPAGEPLTLPYLDQSFDIVAVNSSDKARINEARRLASVGVIGFAEESDPQVLWQAQTMGVPLPTVSIIIPCHNGASLTDACLRSLTQTLPPDFRGEIIVVDDASNDDTPTRLEQWTRRDHRVSVIRNETNVGFLGSTTRGADVASGEILIFLNNDTVPLAGWLSPLLKTFRDFPSAGAVGGKLIFPDGTLQEAGGMIFKDGSAAHFGRDDHQLDAGVYNLVREVDYCSGALLATPRILYEELGGFDQQYAPAYYEDTDYCFKVRAAGHRIYYQPASAVVHLEGASCGTDVRNGVKRYQSLNHLKFTKKWSRLLDQLPERPEWNDTGAWRGLAFRGAVELSL